ncbi:DUF3592 domain-containing protein [Aquipuribacter nitratireducens]|uniref:DUF3592 domain-containing protein n=1 Tax=Aquipuribacter nitratireducens TaxID=650104 RepID=A0ABW0GNX0_9MICO
MLVSLGFLSLLGVVFLLGAVDSVRDERAFEAGVARTTATVLSIDYERRTPVVQLRFETRGGGVVEAATKEFTPPEGDYRLLAEGDSLDVIYQLDAPARVRAVEWSEQYWHAWELGLLGAFFLLLAWGPFAVDMLARVWAAARGSQAEWVNDASAE